MDAPRIATITMNPAIDVSTAVGQVVSDRKLRCGATALDPGGGGINVARVIHRLGGNVLALFTSGGATGSLLEDLLAAEGVPHLALPVAQRTRENLNVLEESSGRQFRFVLQGPALSVIEWRRCLGALARLDPFPPYVVASGSLPPGAPVDFYAHVARLARDRRSRLVLDTSGEPLRRALDEGVYLFKPSVTELRALVGSSAAEEAELESAARELVHAGRSRVVVLSLGAGGLLWVSEHAGERIAAPAVAVRSGVGAGDSLVAGVVLALSRGEPMPEAMRFGLAAATASVMREGTRLCRPEDAERMLVAVHAAPALALGKPSAELMRTNHETAAPVG
jgi:6-phosphofructokinase 2